MPSDMSDSGCDVIFLSDSDLEGSAQGDSSSDLGSALFSESEPRFSLDPAPTVFLPEGNTQKKEKDAASQNENELEDCGEIGQYSTA